MDWKSFWNHSPHVTDDDVCQQVGRTFKKVSYSQLQIETLTATLIALLEPGPDQTLLDLGCGNGLVTSRLASQFSHVTAIDFSEPLIDTARRRFAAANIEYRLADVTDPSIYTHQYDCALMSGALQHIRPSQADRMFHALATAVKPEGRVVLGDVPDRERRWCFYRGPGGRLRVLDRCPPGPARDRPVVEPFSPPTGGWTVRVACGDPVSACRPSESLLPIRRRAPPRSSAAGGWVAAVKATERLVMHQRTAREQLVDLIARDELLTVLIAQLALLVESHPPPDLPAEPLL